MPEQTDCGRKETCGGYFSDGPGDSDWRECARHAEDRPRFLEIYKAQLRRLFGGAVAHPQAPEQQDAVPEPQVCVCCGGDSCKGPVCPECVLCRACGEVHKVVPCGECDPVSR